MPEKYFKEMICDRVAASMIYLGDKYQDTAPFDYYLYHKDENQFTTNTALQLEHYLKSIAENGFEQTMKGLK